MSITLTHPTKGCQVIVPDNVAESYIAQGWVVPGSSTPAETDSAPSKSWKVDELKAYADERGIDLGSATKKADILTAIENSSEEGDNADADNGEADAVPADADGGADD